MKPFEVDLRQLRYFVTVIEQGSLRAAALRLHVSQPPLTRQMQHLERAVGTTLLVRSAQGVAASDAGWQFYAEARNILALTLRATRHTRLVGQGHAGRLDIGVFGSPIFDMIPHIIGMFGEQNRGVEVALHTLDRSEQLKALRERRIDVGFNRFVSDEPGLRWETIEIQSLDAAIFTAHRLASRPAVTLAQLVNEELIFYPRAPRPGFTDHVLGLFARHGLMPQHTINVDDVPTAIAMVACGRGIAIVPSSAANLQLRNVAYRPFVKKDRGSVESCMIYRDDHESPLVRRFLETARSYYRLKRSQQKRSGQPISTSAGRAA